MKYFKKTLWILIGISFGLIAIFLLDNYPKLQSAIPYILILILYVRYDTKLENMSMDLLTAEEQIEALSNGDWVQEIRFRGNPYTA